jgi:hypothetical protein
MSSIPLQVWIIHILYVLIGTTTRILQSRWKSSYLASTMAAIISGTLSVCILALENW